MNTTLADTFRATAVRYPAEPALRVSDDVLTYSELLVAVESAAHALRSRGVMRGDRVGINIPSATTDLYVAILATLFGGAAYVPVDFDDTDERKHLVFTEADVRLTLTAGSVRAGTAGPSGLDEELSPSADDDAWVIFTSGTTGKPKGVAISHASACAFIEAERQLFCLDAPIGPGDNVFAGLSVAFDASIEEMWLAWANGACLTPAPRSLVKAGHEIGPWLRHHNITVVSTVPSLLSLWDADDLADVRLLIVGGEACSAQLVETYAHGRQMWNTYGPTEATVVATAHRLRAGADVLIGEPLHGWQVAIIDTAGRAVADGEQGELVIAGVGLGRYLDAAKDAEKFRSLPELGWERAYFTGDLVSWTPDGLAYHGRIDDQVKINGRRIELGEIDAVLTSLPQVTNAAAAVHMTGAGTRVLAGYLVASEGVTLDLAESSALLKSALPAGISIVLGQLDEMPLGTSGKTDRKKLPWPMPSAKSAEPVNLSEAELFIASHMSELVGLPLSQFRSETNFFNIGGTSLATARLATILRERWPHAGVTDVYETTSLGQLAQRLGGANGATAVRTEVEELHETGLNRAAHSLGVFGAVALGGALAGLALWEAHALWAWFSDGVTPPLMFWVLLALGLPGVRDVLVAGVARMLVAGITPGRYPRRGAVHLRVRIANRIVAAAGPRGFGGTVRDVWFARLLGNPIGADVHLATHAPVTGTLSIGRGATVGPGADVDGHEVEGQTFVIAPVVIGADAVVEDRAVVPGGVTLPTGAVLESGAIAQSRRGGGETSNVAFDRIRTATGWEVMYLLTSSCFSLVRALTSVPALAAVVDVLNSSRGVFSETAELAAGSAASLALYAVVLGVSIRALSVFVQPGVWQRGSRQAWAAWSVMALTTTARTMLYPLYASMLTPIWFRLLGARMGRNVEISTASGLPSMMTLDDGSFLADDVLIAAPTWRHGRLEVAPAYVGKRSFVGNSGIVRPGTRIGNDALIGVLSTAPHAVADHEAWMGRPAGPLRRTPDVTDAARTFAPQRKLKVARGAVETARLVPLLLSATMASALVCLLWPLAASANPLVLIAASVGWYALAGLFACAVALAAKWTLVGRIAAGEHPLWSSFVWRNELADTFLEALAMPWLLRQVHGTPLMNLWHRLNGVRITSDAWCETHWLPEADLITIGRAATIGRGVVVQTHLFQDRVMRLQQVEVRDGASIGSHSVMLPESVVGDGAWVSTGSLVMRGDQIPDRTLWQGNPVKPVLVNTPLG